MDLPDLLSRWPNGEIVLTGHRIGLYSVIDLYQRRCSVDEIRDEFLTLESDLIHGVIAYYEGHRTEVDAYVAEYRADLDRQETESETSSAVLRDQRRTDRPETLIRLLPPCLHWHPDGEIRVVGRRIGLFHILEAHHELGKTPEMIAEEYELSPELIHEILSFTEDHPAEVGAYMADYQDELDRQFAAYQPTPAVVRIRRLVEERGARTGRPDS